MWDHCSRGHPNPAKKWNYRREGIWIFVPTGPTGSGNPTLGEKLQVLACLTTKSPIQDPKCPRPLTGFQMASKEYQSWDAFLPPLLLEDIDQDLVLLLLPLGPSLPALSRVLIWLSKGGQNLIHVNLNHFPGARSTGYLRTHWCLGNFNPLPSSEFEDNATLNTLSETLELPAAHNSRKWAHGSPSQAPTNIVLCIQGSPVPSDVVGQVWQWWI